eukprot:Gb_28043 [translate_table: standard]
MLQDVGRYSTYHRRSFSTLWSAICAVSLTDGCQFLASHTLSPSSLLPSRILSIHRPAPKTTANSVLMLANRLGRHSAPCFDGPFNFMFWLGVQTPRPQPSATSPLRLVLLSEASSTPLQATRPAFGQLATHRFSMALQFGRMTVPSSPRLLHQQQSFEGFNGYGLNGFFRLHQASCNGSLTSMPCNGAFPPARLLLQLLQVLESLLSRLMLEPSSLMDGLWAIHWGAPLA